MSNKKIIQIEEMINDLDNRIITIDYTAVSNVPILVESIRNELNEIKHAIWDLEDMEK